MTSRALRALEACMFFVAVGCQATEPRVATAEHDLGSAISCSGATSVADRRQLTLHVEALTCEGCAWQIRDTLHKVDGIQDVTATASKRVVVTYDARLVTAAAAIEALEQVGYKSLVIPPDGLSR